MGANKMSDYFREFKDTYIERNVYGYYVARVYRGTDTTQLVADTVIGIKRMITDYKGDR
jgi:hypothetical protein